MIFWMSLHEQERFCGEVSHNLSVQFTNASRLLRFQSSQSIIIKVITQIMWTVASPSRDKSVLVAPSCIVL